MVKRAKKAASIVDHPAPPPYAPVGEDYARARLKIQSLQDDYEDLAKDNDAMKRRLHEAKHKKRVLLAQVRFLREKYRFLMENPRNLTFPQHQRPEEGHKSRPSKSSKAAAVAAAYQERPPSFPATTYFQHPGGIETQPSMRIDKSNKETMSRKKFLVLDLNETSVPFMDEPNEYHHGPWPANPASTWEKQLQPHPQHHHHHHPPESLDPAAAAADLKLSACRSMGKDAATRPGKRKITWQDQVALRV